MEAKEFQIGDVFFNNVIGWVQGIVIDDYKAIIDGEEFEDEFDPIPITAEILELNGFKYDDCEKCWKLIEKDGRYTLYSIYVNTNRISIYNWRNEEGERFTDACNKVNVHYKYVHEVQHALRLCGLSELAHNFIVK